MKERRWGRIVNTVSVHVTGGGRPGVSSYSAAKAAVAGFGRTVAKALGAWGVTVNTIAPGYIETEMLDDYPPAFSIRSGANRRSTDSAGRKRWAPWLLS